MKPLRERVEDRIRETICRACIYEKVGGGCALDQQECPIISRVDRIIDVVRTVRSDKIDPYVDRLREVVCANCAMQDSKGYCAMRVNSDCALDDYFVLIVDLVEQELSREASAAV